MGGRSTWVEDRAAPVHTPAMTDRGDDQVRDFHVRDLHVRDLHLRSDAARPLPPMLGPTPRLTSFVAHHRRPLARITWVARYFRLAVNLLPPALFAVATIGSGTINLSAIVFGAVGTVAVLTGWRDLDA